jgi:hypothetical protein
MKASNEIVHAEPMQQLTNNVTSWIGHSTKENKEMAMGQTFIASKEADLESIEVFSSIVAVAGDVAMTVHSFDTQQQTWGPALATANVNFNKDCTGKWISFDVPRLHLNKGQSYGFKLASHNSLVGVGEAAGSAKEPPFANGQKWQFINDAKKGDSFTYFSLAFKLGLKAA